MSSQKMIQDDGLDTSASADDTGQSPAHYTNIIPRLEVLDAAAKIINPQPFRAIGHTC